MNETITISCKCGTGTTTITAAFAFLAQKHVLDDCDVDAADLHILARPEIKSQEEFQGGVIAIIDPNKCTECGECRAHCRFDAITEDYQVNQLMCEGCSVCYHVCPAQAVAMEDQICGNWFISDSRLGPMVHADLFPGEENSGKLVAVVRGQAKDLAKDKSKNLILVDGAPGVGCPVISSVAGSDHVIVVTEPSLSGLHDMRRVIELVRGFDIPVSALINKCDVNVEVASTIEKHCEQDDVPLLGKIPYDPGVIMAMVTRSTVFENGGNATVGPLRDAWSRVETEILSQ